MKPTSRRPRLGRTMLLIFLAFALLAPASAFAKKKKDKKMMGVIAGRVMNQQEDILKEIQVTITSNTSGEQVGAAKTNKKGEFKLDIPAASGTYKVRLEGEGYAPFEADLELEGGNRQDIDFKMLDAAAGMRNQAIAIYNEGAAAHRESNREVALTKFREAAELDATLAPAHLGLADLYLQAGDLEAARTAIETFMELEPEDEQGRKVAFEVYRRAGMMDEAKKIAGDLGDGNISKDIAVGLYNEGALASQNGDLQLAQAKFQEAADADPELAEAHAGLASVFYNQQKYPEAIAAASRALELKPEHEQALRLRYLVFDAIEDPRANEAWESYRGLNQAGAVDLLYRRAELDHRDGNADKALPALLKVLELQPDMARAHYTLGLVYMSSDTDKAKQHLQKFITMAPDDPEVTTAKEMLSYF